MGALITALMALIGVIYLFRFGIRGRRNLFLLSSLLLGQLTLIGRASFLAKYAG